MRLTIAYSKIKKRNLVLINNDIYQETLSERPIRQPLNYSNMWPNPTKPGTSRKTCFWVNSHKRWLAQNYFQIFKFVFSCLLIGEQCILSNTWKNLFKWDFFQTINDGLSLLIPIHSCSKWRTNWPISKCSEAKICRCHLQNQPYLEKCLNLILVSFKSLLWSGSLNIKSRKCHKWPLFRVL